MALAEILLQLLEHEARQTAIPSDLVENFAAE